MTAQLLIIKPTQIIKQIQARKIKQTLRTKLMPITKQVTIRKSYQQVGINCHILYILHMLMALKPGGEMIFWLA